jgi:hypothetical protein
MVLTISHRRTIASAISAIRHQEGRLVPVDCDAETPVAFAVGAGSAVGDGVAAGLAEAVAKTTAPDSAAPPAGAAPAGAGTPAAASAGAWAADSTSLADCPWRSALMAAGGLVDAGLAPRCGCTLSDSSAFDDIAEFIVDGACTAICT